MEAAMRREHWPSVFVQVQRLLVAADRVAWFIALGCPESAISLTSTLVQDISNSIPDAVVYDQLGSSIPTANDGSPFDIYAHPRLLRLVLTDDRFSELRRRKVRPASALERGCDVSIVELLLQQIDTPPSADRELSYALLTAFEQEQKTCTYDSQQVTSWMRCFPSNTNDSQQQPVTNPSTKEESIASCSQCSSVLSDSRLRDLLHELTQACEDNDLERVDTLLSEYSRFNANGDCVWHAKLLKLAIDRRHFCIVELLLRCDPRGRIIRIEELLAALQPMSPRGDRKDGALESSAVVDILTGEEPLYAGLTWDAVALDQAIDTSDQHLLHFLLEHVDFSRHALESAHSRTISVGNTAFSAALSSVISTRKWTSGKPATSNNSSLAASLPAFEYKEGERVSVQYAGGIHFWTGTFHRCWLNGTYDVCVTEHSESPVEAHVPASALHSLSAWKLADIRRSVISSVAQSTVDLVVTTAANGVCEQSSRRLSPGDHEGDGSEDGDDSGSDESECPSDCDCGCESGSSSDLERDSDSDSDSNVGSDSCSSDDESHDVPILTIPTPSDCSADTLYNIPETDDGELIIGLDAAAIEGLAVTGIIDNRTEQHPELDSDQKAEMPQSAATETTASDIPAPPSLSFSASTEPTTVTEAPLGGVNNECTHASSTTLTPIGKEMPTAADPAPTREAYPTIVSCAVTWTSSTVDLALLSDLQVGDRVDARFRGREPWLHGRIAECHRDKLTFAVAYDDGEYEDDVVREYIKLVMDAAEDGIVCEPSTGSTLEESYPVSHSVGSEDDALRDTADNDCSGAVTGEAPAEILPATSLPSLPLGTVAVIEPPDLWIEPAEVVSVDLTTNDSAGGSSLSESRVTNDSEAVHHEEHSVEAVTAAPPVVIDVPTTVDVLRVERERDHLRFHAGQEIEANFLGIGKFHPARIVHVHANSEAYDVAFSEFDQTELRVLPVNIRPPRASTRRIKALLKGSSSSVMPLENIASTDGNSDGNASDSSRSGDQSSSRPASSKLDEARRSSISQLVAPLPPSATERPQTSRISRSSSSGSRTPALRRENSRVQGRLRTNNRAASSSREVEEWRNVDIILNRKRRLLNAPTGNVESTKVPWGEEFASIQSLKRFATQHPDVLRDHIVSQLGELGIQSVSPARNLPSPTRGSSQTRMASARETLLMIKDLAFLLHQRLSPFFDVIVPVVLPAVFSSDRRFLCDTAYEVLEALVLHCSGRKLALALLQQGAQFNSQEDFRLLNLTSVYVEKCFGNFSAAESAALAASEPSKSTTAIAQMLTLLLNSKSIPTRIAIEKSLLHLRQELGERRFETFLRANLEPVKADSILLGDQSNTAVSNAPPMSRSPRKQRRDKRTGSGGNAAVACQSPSILQRMLQQRHSRVRPSPSHV